MSQFISTGSRAGWRRVWWILSLLFAIYVIVQQVEAVLWEAHLVPHAGTVGATQAQMQADPAFAPGFVAIASVDPGSPLAQAGVGAGDHLRFEPTWDYLRYHAVGEHVSGMLDHAGRQSHIDLVAAPRATQASDADLKSLLFDLSNLIPALFGAFIMWRSRGKTVAMLLGTALVVFGLGVASPQFWQSGPLTFVPLYGLHLATITSVNFFLVAFALRFAAEVYGGMRRWHWIALALYGVINLVVWWAWFYPPITVTILPLLGDGGFLLQLIGDIGFATSLLLLFLGWRRAGEQERRRFTLMLIGFSAIVISQIVAVYLYAGSQEWFDATKPALIIYEVLAGVVAPVTLTYAILRHRVLDLGFALNRTLVYGAVSAILLAAFGLIEWAVEHFVKIEGRESNAVIDAAIALGVFLAFHRVRDVVKPAVERLFFRAWQDKEAALRRFTKEAGYILKTEALTAAFVAALDRFTDGAGAALYLRNDEGDYVRAESTLAAAPAAIDADDPAIVCLRSDRTAAEIEATQSRLPANLALPMVNRTDIIGFALLGAKPGAVTYRPDEQDVLAYAAQQIGLDLHTLKVESLEQRVLSLETRNTELRAALKPQPVT